MREGGSQRQQGFRAEMTQMRYDFCAKEVDSLGWV